MMPGLWSAVNRGKVKLAIQVLEGAKTGLLLDARRA